jgi:hypothetical protein
VKLRLVLKKSDAPPAAPAATASAPSRPPVQQAPSTIEKPRRVVVKQAEEPRPPARVDPFESLPPKARSIAGALNSLLDHFEKWDSKKNPVFMWAPNDVTAPGYSDVVKRPMAFSIMRANLQRGAYESMDSFSTDLLLIIDNAMLFNPVGSYYYDLAVKLLKEAKKVQFCLFGGFFLKKKKLARFLFLISLRLLAWWTRVCSKLNLQGWS